MVGARSCFRTTASLSSHRSSLANNQRCFRNLLIHALRGELHTLLDVEIIRLSSELQALLNPVMILLLLILVLQTISRYV